MLSLIEDLSQVDLAKKWLEIWDRSPSDAYWNKACHEAREAFREAVGEGK